MDPLDLGKNVEGSGSTKRRISSILKAPRKSSVLQNLEQQNNEVESDKPVEKRNSRRVSFAPDNDVVLFAKEPKNVSSAYNPLELLLGSAAGTTQNRFQVLATEDESPQIMGMETLLNAPLHASQQRIMVPLDSGVEFGEKTVLFSAEDAVMDLTHSHSINLNSGALLLGDLSHENFDLIHSGREGNDIEVFRDVASSHSVQATNPSTEKRPPAHTRSHLDPDFKSFLLSLSQPSAVLTGMTALAGPSSDEAKSSSGKSETRTSDVDKENQVPNSLSSSRKSGEAFRGSAFHPEGNLSMDLTGVQTGHILGAAADDDPFQCLFPTQDMFEMSNRRESDNLKANKSLVNPSVATPHESQKVSSVLKKDSRETTVGKGDDLRFTEFPVSFPKTSIGNPENPRIQPPSSTQTVGAGGSLSQHELWRNDIDQENCPARTRRSWREPLSVISPEGDISMEMTAAQTGHIMGGDVSMEMTDFQTGRITEILPLCESQKKEAFTLEQQNIDRPQSSHEGMETSKTSVGNPENPRIQPPSSTQTVGAGGSLSQHELWRNDIDQENCPARTRRSWREPLSVISPEGDISMEMTAAQTGHIMGGDVSMEMTDFQTGRITEILPLCESHKKEAFTLEQQNIDRPQSSHTGMETSKTNGVNPENPRIQPPSSTQTVGDGGSLSQHELWRNDIDQENCPARTRRSWREPLSVISPEGDISMEMTAAQTGHIMGGDVSMEMTDFQTGRITEILPLCESQKKEAFTLEQQNIGRPQSSHTGMETSKTSGGNPENPRFQPPSSTQTVGAGGSLSQHELWRNDIDQENCPARTRRSWREPLSVISPEGDISMEMTAAQTGHIMGGDVSMEMTDFQTGRITEILPLCESQKKEAFTLEQQNIDRPQSSHAGMETSSKLSLNIRHQDKVVPADGSREKTSACLDVTKSRGVYITANVKPDSHPNVNVSPTCGEKTVRFTADDAAMDITECVNMSMATGLGSDCITSVTEKDQHGLLTRLSSRNDCNAGPVCARMTAVTAEPPAGFSIYQEDDMDITQAQTGCVLGAEASVNVTGVQTGRMEEAPHKQEPPQAVLLSGGSNSADSLMTTVQRNQVEFDSKYDCRDGAVRFPASGGCMDATQYDTVDMTCDLSLRSLPNVVFSSNGEKTVRFSANDADIDVTKSHTVRIVKGLPLKCSSNAVPPADGEKNLGFDALDVTASQGVNFVKSLPLKCSSNAFLPAGGEKTVRFHATDAEMDMTKSHTVALQSFPNGEKLVLSSAKDDVTTHRTVEISTDLQSRQNENMERNSSLLACQKGDLLPADEERTVWSDGNEVEMDVTRCRTMILENSTVVPDQLFNEPPSEEENQAWLPTNGATLDVTRSSTLRRVTGFDQKPDQIIDSLSANPERMNYTLVDETESETKSILKNAKRASQSNEFLLAPADKAAKLTTNDATVDTTHCRSVNTVDNQLVDPVLSDQNTSVALPMKDSASGKLGLDSNQSSSAQSEHSTSNDFLFQPSGAEVNPQRDVDAKRESPSWVSDDVVKTMNKTHTEETNASMDMSEERLGSSKQDPLSKGFKEPGLTLQSRGALGSHVSVPENKENQPEEEEETHAVSQKMESSPSTADQNADGPSRRRSLANLTSRVKRLSQLIKAAPATDDCTAPLPRPDSDLDKSPERKTPSAAEPELEMSPGNNTNDGDAQNLTEAGHPSVATSSKTKRLMSRLTIGGFKPKLPKRNDADESAKASFEGDPAKTPAVDVTQRLSRFDQTGNIQDEELVDFEDLSESVNVTVEKEGPSDEFDVSEPLEDGVFVEDVTIGRSQSQKRPAGGNDWEERKRLKTDAEFFGTTLQPDVDGESSVATDGSQPVDSSHRSETASRCHTASESTCKNSLFESQLEDCVSDGLKKLEDGTITVLEFFNLFSIDFVINNPRQSVVSGRLLANEDVTPLDLLKDKYISRPKQQVYETDAKTLTGKIEGLKHRKQDLNKPLKTLNRPLWEEVKNFTEEELKSFGAKLKEQNNFFRKQSRVQTHEMKEVLYSSLVPANLEEKQKVLEKINQADEMIQTLDSCIAEVEAELNAIEEKGSEDKPGLRSLQKGNLGRES
ncbi:uncharacterized protein LOC105935411 [Fundulus heteroclitus]|uniref:uncharacterized protein LOC105935411 n=1 Tax=Fundulus heteroclitus TaxID=8078 RepID=UPI00165C2B21|nr:uncharacterized protein LOC105935411 [Fundulus heteroclitus]